MALSGADLRGRRFVRSLVAVVAATLPFERAVAIGPNWPNEVTANYKLSFSGINVGVYRFHVRFSDKSYAAVGKTKISALFGAFKWVANFSGKGTVEPTGVRPAIFEMSYKSKKKVTSVKIGFHRARGIVGCINAQKAAPSRSGEAQARRSQERV